MYRNWILQYHTLVVLSTFVLHVWPQQTVPLCRDIPLSELDDPSPFTCTTLIAQTWSGSAFTDQCPSAMFTPDVIVLNANALSTGTCGVFSGAVTSVSGNDVTSSLSFTPTQDIDGLGIQCHDGLGDVVPDSNFTIEISDNLIITTVEDSPTTYGCVTATLQALAGTTGITNYKVEAIFDGNVFAESTSDDASDLEAEICGLNLCDNSYMYRAEANGGNICPSELTSATITLSALGRVSGVRRSGADSIEWNRPNGAPVDPGDCSIEYTVSVTGRPGGPDTSSTTSNMISLSAINGDLDTCDSNLRITVIAEVPSIGAVAGSISDPFDPTSAFPPNANGVDIVDPPTYAITDSSTVIQLMTTIGNEVLQLFPEGFINVSYSGSSCGGSSRVMNGVAQVDIGCLGETNVEFTAVLMDDPDCRSSSSSLPPQSFPLISEPDFPLRFIIESDSVTVSFLESDDDDLRVEGGNFSVIGTATPVNGGSSVTSDPTTFPDDAVFCTLEPNTSYNFVIQLVSQASDGIMIGSFSGTFTTLTVSGSSTPIWIVAPIVVGVLLLIATGTLVGVCIYKKKRKHFASDLQQPVPMYENISPHNSPRDIDLKDNIAYGPVTPKQPAAVYEEVPDQPERIEMSGNVAYGQISH